MSFEHFADFLSSLINWVEGEMLLYFGLPVMAMALLPLRYLLFDRGSHERRSEIGRKTDGSRLRYCRQIPCLLQLGSVKNM